MCQTRFENGILSIKVDTIKLIASTAVSILLIYSLIFEIVLNIFLSTRIGDSIVISIDFNDFKRL